MSNINTNNYTGPNAVIVGNAAAPWEVKQVGSSELAELTVYVGKGYKKGDQWVDQGSDKYTLQATSDYASDNWPEVGKGDKVRIDDAKLTARVYKKQDGEPGVDLQLRYGSIVVLEAKGNSDSGGATPF